MKTYLDECRITDARQALEVAMKEYVSALRVRGVPTKGLVCDVSDVLAWATDQEVCLSQMSPAAIQRLLR